MNIIENFVEVHGDKYDYSKSIYLNCRAKVDIVCKKHGIFKQLPLHHLNGQGCKKCAQFSNIDNFIKKSIDKHGDKYDYSKVTYIRSNINVLIICREHGEFEQTPNSHLSSHGCPSCTKTKKLSLDSFIKRSNDVHNNKFDYSKVKYKSIHSRIIILCKEHGEFKQTPNSHISGSSCPRCSSKFGKLENEWLDMLSISNRQHKIKNYRVDGYDPDSKTIYEFYGDYWHGNPNIYNPNDINRNNNIEFGNLYKKTIERESEFIKLGFNIISIWESDFIKNKNIKNDTI